MWRLLFKKNIVTQNHAISRRRIRRTAVLRKRKVGHLSPELREGKKQKTKRITVADDTDAGIGWISELPESVIHRIFAHLNTQDVLRTNILSTWWKSKFDSLFVLDLDERKFQARGVKGKHNRIKAREVQKRMFNQYVEESWVSRLGVIRSIYKFKLYVRTLDYTRFRYMRQWLRAAVQKNVNELEIHVEYDRYYFLQDVVLSSQTITSLKLSGHVINNTAINLCNLRILFLKDTHITEDRIREMAESCLLIEDLRLVNCMISRFSIPTHDKLRRVELHNCKYLSHIEIDVPTLETFCYHALRNQRCRIHLEGCRNLKHLVLKDRSMKNSKFRDLFYKYPLLETLVLQECRYLRRLTISSSKLKSLALIHCEKLQEINVDAPNLYSFQYNGDGRKLTSMKVPNLHEAKLYFVDKKTSSFLALNKKFFETLDASKGFKLITYSRKDMIIYEEPRGPYLFGNPFDKVVLTASSAGVLRIIDKWLREAHGNSLTLIQIHPRSYALWRSIRAMIVNREANPECCRFYSNKCWRHYLDGVRIEDFSMKFTWRSR